MVTNIIREANEVKVQRLRRRYNVSEAKVRRCLRSSGVRDPIKKTDQKAKATGSHNMILCVVECRPNRHQLFCLPAAADPFISDQRSPLLTLLLPPHPLLHLGLCRLVLLFSLSQKHEGAPIYWSLGFSSKNMFFVLFLNMKHSKQKLSSPFGRPSCDTENLVLSELSLFIPPQNLENKI